MRSSSRGKTYVGRFIIPAVSYPPSPLRPISAVGKFFPSPSLFSTLALFGLDHSLKLVLTLLFCVLYKALLVFTLHTTAVSSLSYVPGYFNFTANVNGSLLAAPALMGYGVDHFPTFIAATAMWYENCTAKACVLDRPIHGKSPEDTVRSALKFQKSKGYGTPKALFLPSTVGLAGFGQLSRDFSDVSWVKIPTLDVSVAVFMLAQTVSGRGYPTQLVFEIRDDDVGPVEKAWPFGDVVISAAVLTALVLICFGTNIYKFVIHLKYTQGVTTAKIFFVLDLVANFMRLWYTTVNPYFTARFDFTFTTICAQTHVALTVICTLLLALKWRELLLKTKLHVTVFLTVFKWPFIIGGTLVFLFEFITAAFRGHWYDISTVSKVSTSFLIVASFLCATLLFVSGIQILMHLSKAVGSKRRLWTLSSTTFLILISGVFLLLWSVLQMVYMIEVYRPSVKIITQSLVHRVQIIQVCSMASLLICSFLQSMAMPLPAEFVSSNTNTNTRNSMASSHSRHSISRSKTTSRNHQMTSINAGHSSAVSSSAVSPAASPPSPHTGLIAPSRARAHSSSTDESDDSESPLAPEAGTDFDSDEETTSSSV